MDTVGAIIPCYKRPELAERLLDSIAEYCPEIWYSVVVLQPEDLEHTPAERKRVWWANKPQMHASNARNIGASEMRVLYKPSLYWFIDDDAYAYQHTHLDELIALFRIPSTGVVTMTSRRNESHQFSPVAKDVCRPLNHLNGGYMIRASVFWEIEGFSSDGSDEYDFCIRLYLRGYRNYYSRRSAIIHEAGKASEGGHYGAFKEASEGKPIEQFHDSQYTEDHLYLQAEPEPLHYGKYKSDSSYGKNFRITEAGKALHKRNYDARFKERDANASR